MSEILRRYREVDYRLPETYLSWDLFGAGLDNLGRGGKAIALPLKDPAPDQILLRVDALGLCFSDAKLIWAGSEHPRIRGRDLARDPTVAGHEAAMTVVKVGADWRGGFEIGQRFIIQADIRIGGEQKAFGYVQRGAMAQYAYAGPWVLNGEGVCHLLPLADSTGYGEAALVEPWACVEAAYHISTRISSRPRGKALIVTLGEGSRIDFTGVFGKKPGLVVLLGGDGRFGGGLDVPAVHSGEASPEAVRLAAEKAGGFDDVFIIGVPRPEMVEACDGALAEEGILAFLSDREIPGKAAIDIGRAHYHLTRFIGSSSNRAVKAYGQNIRQELRARGRTWMVGAAGPMGQMHVQRALELPDPPALLFCTDLSDERLDYMDKRLRPLADRKGVRLICVNAGKEADLAGRVADITRRAGFDDVYVHAPAPELVEQAAEHLADCSILNVFAGVGIGVKARLSPEIFRTLHARLLGSSGSSMDDIDNTLAKLESGRLATRMSLAALGGIEAVWTGVKGVKENRFPGKTVIYPQVRGVDLVGLDAFGTVCPAAAARLEDGCVWTNAAEEVFLEEKLRLPEKPDARA